MLIQNVKADTVQKELDEFYEKKACPQNFLLAISNANTEAENLSIQQSVYQRDEQGNRYHQRCPSQAPRIGL